ncbi:phosphodiester glycosidase family protein, partial [Fervidobacterium sp.]
MEVRGVALVRKINAKYSIIILFSIIFTASLLNAQIFLINNKIYEPTNGYFDESQLREMGFSIVKSERIYLIHNKKLIIGSNGDFLIDFDSYFPKAYITTNGNIFVKQEFLIAFFKLIKIDDIYYDKPITVNSINYSNNILTITTSVQIRKELFKTSFVGNTLKISLSPAQYDFKTPNGVTISKSNDTINLELQTRIIDFTVQFSDNKIIIDIQPYTDRVIYEKRTEKFAGRTFTVNYIIVDPKQVNITPLIPSKGIGSTATLQTILNQNGYSAGINANYFDPATGLPIDIIISNGKILSHRYGLRPMFVQTTDNKVFIGKTYMDVTIRIGEVLLLVKGVNTTSLSEVNLYTEEFRLKIPNDFTKIYVVVKNGKIVSIGYPGTVPTNSQVIMLSKELVNRHLPNLAPGLSVSVEIFTDNGYSVKNAVGAGPLLLQNGEIIPDAAEEKLRYSGGIPTTRADRTIIAIKEGKVYFITIEGANGVGMNFDEAAQFLKSKGFESAMMLDGGGSTAMVYGGKYVTNGTPRSIPV